MLGGVNTEARALSLNVDCVVLFSALLRIEIGLDIGIGAGGPYVRVLLMSKLS